MALLFADNFEINSATAGVMAWAVNNGPPTYSTTTKENGSRSLRASSMSSGAAMGLSYQFVSAAGTGPYFTKFRFNYHTLPSAANVICTLNGAAAFASIQAADPAIKLTSTGTLQLFNNTQVGSDSAVLAADTWHTIEMKFDKSPAGGSQVLEAKLNGVIFATASNLTLNRNVIALELGGNLFFEAQTTGDWFFGNVVFNDSTAGGSFTSYVGNTYVTVAHPTGAGDNTAWALFAGTPNWSVVSEVTPDGNTTAVQSLTAGQIDDYAITAPSELGANDVITAVMVGVNYEGTGASANSLFVVRLKAVSGGTVSESANIDPTSTLYVTNSKAQPLQYKLIAYTKPGGSVPFTKTDINASQIGLRLSSANTNRARVTTEWLTILYTPAPVGKLVSDIQNTSGFSASQSSARASYY